MKRKILIGVAACLSSMPFGVRPVHAAVYIVDQAIDDMDSASDCTTPVLNDCSLREAVVAANANAGLDTIRLPNATCSLTIPRAPSDDATSGDLDVTDAVTIEPQLGAVPVIDAGGAGGMADRVFHFHAAAGQSTISRINVRNGYIPAELGGGILVNAGADVLLEDGQLTGNAANAGGGIEVSNGSTVTIVGTEISGNTVSPWGGGGIRCTGALTVEDAVIRGNVAGSGGGGASLIVGCNAAFTRTEISENTATNGFLGATGGGITVGACAATTLTNVTISGNAAHGSGGGISIGAAAGFCGPGIVAANNVTLADNQSDSDLNGSGDGGGLFQDASCASFATFCATFQNSIVALNRDGAAANDCAGAPTQSAGYNMINTTRCPLVAAQGTDDGTDPGLDPTLAANDAGWTVVNAGRTHGLIAGSPTNPSINSANATTCATTDQRGVARVGQCDRGAFEADVCGNSVTRDPEQCDPSGPLCTTQCRASDPKDHNTPFSTDNYKAGLVVAHEACTLPLAGLTDSISGKPACNVVPLDPTPCEFDTAVSGSKGIVDVSPLTSGGGKIEFRLRLLKMKPACNNRKFRMKISLEETIADCTGLPDPNKDSCTIQRTLLEDVVHGSPDFCQVSPSTGNCDYTVLFTTTSAHKVANGHRTSIAVREITVIDADTNAQAFVPGVLLK